MKKEHTEEIPIWENNLPNICRFCAYAAKVTLSDEIYCEKEKQVVSQENVCKRFKYDILKKEMRRRKMQTRKYDSGQFTI